MSRLSNVSPISTGDLVGYTEGEENYPTLYYENGRYTVAHKNPENVGWHPHDESGSKVHHRMHVKEQLWKSMVSAYGRKEAMKVVGEAPATQIGLSWGQPGLKLVEVYSTEHDDLDRPRGGFSRTHPSRSHMNVVSSLNTAHPRIVELHRAIQARAGYALKEARRLGVNSPVADPRVLRPGVYFDCNLS